MEEHYIFRFFRSTWGIYIDIVAEVHPLAQFIGKRYEVEKGLYISLKNKLGVQIDEIVYLPVGLRLIYDQLQPLLEKNGPLIVQIIKIEAPLTDYRPEGLAYAIAGWMKQHFNLGLYIPRYPF